MRGASGLGVKKLAKPPAYVNTLKKLEQQREQLLREAEACTQLSALTLQREQVGGVRFSAHAAAPTALTGPLRNSSDPLCACCCCCRCCWTCLRCRRR